MATKTKTIRYKAFFPPKEIRGSTKVRRQWLSDSAAAWVGTFLNTDIIPGVPAGVEYTYSTKIVGKGSYQELVVYITFEVEGRERLRGTCAACGGAQVVSTSRIVLHGYERPGMGWINGRCFGTRQLPAEVSIELTKQTMKSCMDLADSLDAANKKETAPKYQPHFTVCNRNDPDLMAYKAKMQIRRDRENMAYANRTHAEFLRLNVIPVLGNPLTKEVVA